MTLIAERKVEECNVEECTVAEQRRDNIAEHPSRIVNLDSLRGIAALSVVVFHHFCAFGWFWTAYVSGPKSTLAALLLSPVGYFAIAGHAAVLLFYILSGYVLSLPVQAGNQLPYTAYLAKRAARLYIPYAVCVVLTFGTAHVFFGETSSGLSRWFNKPWQTPVTWTALAEHLFVLRNFDAWPYLPTIWSLVEEMRISLVFPAVAIVALRLPGMAVFVGGLALSGLGIFGPQVFAPALTPYGNTLHYCGFFVIGALLARFREPLQKAIAGLGAVGFGALCLAAVVLYSWDGLFPQVRTGTRETRLLLDWPTAAGAAIIVAISFRIQWLGTPLFAWFGKVSYSLYLCHLPIMLAVFKWGHERCATWVLIGISLVLSVAAAALLQRLVEQPSIALGRSLSRWMVSPATDFVGGSTARGKSPPTPSR